MHGKSMIAALFALVLAGCQTAYHHQHPYQQLLDVPEIEFAEKEQKFISFFEAEPVFRFKVDNPNPMGLPVKNMSFNLTILDQKFIKGASDQDVLIRPASAKVIELSLPFNFMDVFDTADEFQRTLYARFDLDGQMAIGPFSVPYDISGEFDIPRIPSVSVENIRISGRLPEQGRMTMTIAVENPNSFSSPPGFLEYTTTLESTLLGEKWLTPLPGIAPHATRRIVIPIDLSAAQVNGPLSETLKRPTARLVLSGSIRYAVPGRGRRNFPFTEAREIPLVR